MWNWISSNLKLDFFNCDIGLLPMWNWLSSKVRLIFFQYTIWLLLMWNLIFSTVQLIFFLNLVVWYRLVLMLFTLTLTHGMDLDSWYNLRLKALALDQVLFLPPCSTNGLASNILCSLGTWDELIVTLFCFLSLFVYLSSHTLWHKTHTVTLINQLMFET